MRGRLRLASLWSRPPVVEGARLGSCVVERLVAPPPPPHLCDVPAPADLMGDAGPGTVVRCDCGRRYVVNEHARLEPLRPAPVVRRRAGRSAALRASLDAVATALEAEAL